MLENARHAVNLVRRFAGLRLICKLRDELLIREIFYDLREAKVLIEAWRHHYNTDRPHSSLGYKPPAPEAILPAAFMPPYYGSVAA
jgi:transposase InsO family protein